MSAQQSFVPPLASSAGEGRTAAFFDMDYTLLCGSSGKLFLSWLRETGRLPLRQWVAVVGWVGLYITGIMDFPGLISRVMVHAAGSDDAAAWQMSETWFDEVLAQRISASARARVEAHRAQGHHVAIVSASTTYAVKLVARDLGLGEAYIATELEVVDGRLTGAVLQPACYGAGKVVKTKAYAAAMGVDLASSFFYSDGVSDLPLLEAVGHPVAVNPDRKLRSVAMARGWPIEMFC